jgi:hypothetical protein
MPHRFGPAVSRSSNGRPPCETLGDVILIGIPVVILIVEDVPGGNRSGGPPIGVIVPAFTVIGRIILLSQRIRRSSAVWLSFPACRRTILEFVTRIEVFEAGACFAENTVTFSVSQRTVGWTRGRLEARQGIGIRLRVLRVPVVGRPAPLSDG